MNENTTRDLLDQRSFEERVLARFDAFDARFDSIDARFDSIEARLEKLEARNLDTKPIWERALKAIMDTGLEVGEIKTQVGALNNKVDSLETKFDSLGYKVDSLATKFGELDQKVDKLETRLGKVESDLAAMRIDYAGLHDQLIKTQSDFKKKMTRRIDMVLESLVDTHENMLSSDERLTRLESKLA